METVCSSETSVNPYRTVQRYIQGLSNSQQGFVLADDDPSIFMHANVLHRSSTSDLAQTLHLRGWYNRAVSGRRTKWTQSHPTPHETKSNLP
jgi:hypothetical protein